MTKTMIWGASVLLGCAALLAPARADPDTTLVGGITYRFPPDTLDQGGPETGPVGGFLLELVWPEMRGLTLAEQFGLPMPRSLTVMANSGAPKAGAVLSAAALTADVRNSLVIAMYLTGEAHLPPTPATAPPVGAAPGAGMTRIDSVPWPGGDQHDVFVKNPISNPTEFIECTRSGGPGTNPLCDQTFIVNNLVLKVSYERAFAPQWLSIHRKVVQFLEEHEVKQ